MAFDHNHHHQDDIKILTTFGFFKIKKGVGFVFMDNSSGASHVRPEDFYLLRLYTQGQS
jgi:hypothetical protein